MVVENSGSSMGQRTVVVWGSYVGREQWQCRVVEWGSCLLLSWMLVALSLCFLPQGFEAERG